jgi:hypothetical protein
MHIESVCAHTPHHYIETYTALYWFIVVIAHWSWAKDSSKLGDSPRVAAEFLTDIKKIGIRNKWNAKMIIENA